MDSLRKQWGLWVWQMHSNVGLLSPSISHNQKRADSFIQLKEKCKHITPYSQGFAFFGFCATVKKNNTDVWLYLHTHTHTQLLQSLDYHFRYEDKV